MSDFRLEEVRIPEPGTGLVLLGVLYLSLDPYMRGCMDDESSYITGTELFVDGGFAQA